MVAHSEYHRQGRLSTPTCEKYADIVSSEIAALPPYGFRGPQTCPGARRAEVRRGGGGRTQTKSVFCLVRRRRNPPRPDGRGLNKTRDFVWFGWSGLRPVGAALRVGLPALGPGAVVRPRPSFGVGGPAPPPPSGAPSPLGRLGAVSWPLCVRCSRPLRRALRSAAYRFLKRGLWPQGQGRLFMRSGPAGASRISKPDTGLEKIKQRGNQSPLQSSLYPFPLFSCAILGLIKLVGHGIDHRHRHVAMIQKPLYAPVIAPRSFQLLHGVSFP